MASIIGNKKDRRQDVSINTTPAPSSRTAYTAIQNGAKRVGHLIRSKSKGELRRHALPCTSTHQFTAGSPAPKNTATQFALLSSQNSIGSSSTEYITPSRVNTSNIMKSTNGAKLVEIKKQNNGNSVQWKTVENPAPTAKELAAYREIEALKMELKKVKASRGGTTTKTTFPPRGDSGLWRAGIGKLQALGEYTKHPDMMDQVLLLGRLNSAGVYLVPGGEDDAEGTLVNGESD